MSISSLLIRFKPVIINLLFIYFYLVIPFMLTFSSRWANEHDMTHKTDQLHLMNILMDLKVGQAFVHYIKQKLKSNSEDITALP